nr:PREDICTED: uncharacterized protein LOC107399100 [Tribolium castaneum]|eukprot:XP_015840264.1 PREDICTED: uncharacterized protein LOC107399100 [Tribolium castaneum]
MNMGTSNDPIGADILARMEKLEQKLKTRRKTKRRHHRSRSPSPFSSSRGDQDRTCKRRCRRSESIEVLTSSVDDPQRPVLETATSDPLPFLVEAPLDPEILLLLGAPQNSEEPLGEPIHASIAERWPVVIQKGLDPEITQQLLKKYPVGPNCTFAKTPRVNPEISASLTDSVLERDLRLSNKQLQMSACLAAMGKVLSLLLKNEQPDGTSFIEALSDSGRLLCDLFYQDSLLRRTLILELLAVQFRLKCFAKDQHNCEILLRIDNTTAIAHVNRMGGTKYLNKVARSLWQWCEARNIWIFASYIESSNNKEADAEI